MAPRAGLDREAVIEAGVKLVDDEGLAALTLSRVAERLGVKTPSLYKHIAGLEGLLYGIAVWSVQELTRQMSQAAVGRAGDDAVLAMAGAYRAFAKAHPGAYMLSLRAPGPDDCALEAASVELLNLIQTVFSPYGLAGEDAIHTIRAFRSLVHGFVSLEISGGFGMPYDLEASFQVLVTRFLAGLRGPA